MSPVVPHLRRSAATALVAAGVLGSFALATPSADAAFSIPRCSGSSFLGRGSSFQNVLHNGPAAGAPGSAGLTQLFSGTTSSVTCNGHPAIGYNTGAASATTGSGAGRGAMGSGDSTSTPPAGLGLGPGERDNTVRMGGTDEGPTLSGMQAMNTGLLGTSADDAKIHVIPVASSAIVSAVNYPKWDLDGNSANGDEAACPIPDAFRAAGSGSVGYDRVRVTNDRLEKAWSGAYSTWGDFLPGLAAAMPNGADATRYAAGCTDRKLIRAVRQDNSGTTFAWKDFLNNAATSANGGSGTQWRSAYASNSTQNRSWPTTSADDDADAGTARPSPYGNTQRYTGDLDNTFGDIADSNNVCEAAYISAAVHPVCRSASNGAGGEREVLKANNGSIGYIDLATATLSAGEPFKKADDPTDTTYYMPVAEQTSTTSYVEPTANDNGYKVGQSTGGARCANVPIRNLPRGTDPTVEAGWDQVTQVWPTSTGTPLYNACTLTYLLAWDDNAPVYLNLSPSNTYDAEQRRARAVKDYLSFIVSDAGQNAIVGNDYSPLPTTIPAGSPAGTVSAQEAARDGVNAIGWDKQGIGNQNAGGGTTDTGAGSTTNGGAGGAQQKPVAAAPTGTPAPGQQAPVNLFSVGSSRVRGSDILLSFRLPGPGRLVLTAKGTYKQTIKKKKKAHSSRTRTRTVTVGSGTVPVARAGDVSARLPISSAARSALKKYKRMKVTITAVYTPQGGQARTITRTLSLKAPAKAKAKKKSKH